MGVVICGLVQPPAPPQRYQVRDAPPAPQRRCCGDLPSTRCHLRASAPAKPTPVVTIHTQLASTGGGLDQSTSTGTPTQTNYICNGCLNSSRGVIFPVSHRERFECIGSQQTPTQQSPAQQSPSGTMGPCLSRQVLATMARRYLKGTQGTSLER